MRILFYPFQTKYKTELSPFLLYGHDPDSDLKLLHGDDAEKLFYSGKYKDSLDTSIKVTSLVDENIYRKLLSVYDK